MNLIESYGNEDLVLLPPVRAAEIVECARKYIDGSSQDRQSLSSY